MLYADNRVTLSPIMVINDINIPTVMTFISLSFSVNIHSSFIINSTNVSSEI